MPIFDITRICNTNEYYLIEAEDEVTARAMVESGDLVTPYYIGQEHGDGELIVDELDEEQAAKLRKEYNISE